MKSSRLAIASSLLLMLTLTACNVGSSEETTSPQAVQTEVVEESSSPEAPLVDDSFGEAVNTAMAASEATQTAKTTDEWKAVAELWSKAIELMKAVPETSENYQTAQQKATEYQSNLEYAKSNAVQAEEEIEQSPKPFQPAASTQLIDKQPGEWYQGGTLHKATWSEWQKGTYENKVATCADFVASMNNDNLLTSEISRNLLTVEHYRPLAEELAKGIDEAIPDMTNSEERTLFANQKVSEIAVLIMAGAGWLK